MRGPPLGLVPALVVLKAYVRRPNCAELTLFVTAATELEDHFDSCLNIVEPGVGVGVFHEFLLINFCWGRANAGMRTLNSQQFNCTEEFRLELA